MDQAKYVSSVRVVRDAGPIPVAKSIGGSLAITTELAFAWRKEHNQLTFAAAEFDEAG